MHNEQTVVIQQSLFDLRACNSFSSLSKVIGNCFFKEGQFDALHIYQVPHNIEWTGSAACNNETERLVKLEDDVLLSFYKDGYGYHGGNAVSPRTEQGSGLIEIIHRIVQLHSRINQPLLQAGIECDYAVFHIDSQDMRYLSYCYPAYIQFGLILVKEDLHEPVDRDVAILFYVLLNELILSVRSIMTHLIVEKLIQQGLSRRELELFYLLQNAYTNEEIAEHMQVSTHTVRYHIKNLSDKLGVSSRYKLSVVLFRDLVRDGRAFLPK